MPKFKYIGVSTGGKQVSGEIEAANRNDVSALLRRRKIRPLSIKNKPMEFSFSLFNRVNLKNLSRFTRQFSAMTTSGLPLVQCMDILTNQTENKTLAKIIHQISLDVQGGSNLADAFNKHPKVFNNLYCNMIAAGEASGNLDVILQRLADYLERSEALRRKIIGAMIYPVIVLFVAVIVVAVMLTWVVPTFADMFKDLGGTLPLPTRITMAISDFVVAYFFHILIAVVGSIIGLIYYYRTPQGRLVIDSIKLKIPVFGNLERKSAISRFSQTLSTLLSSGITILDALSITSKIAGNKVLEKGLIRTLEKISGGLSIADPLNETKMFPPMVIHMISVGEKTGDLSGMLAKVAHFYQEEVDAAVSALTSILEPIMIVFLAIIVAGIMLAMYLPMFDMIGMIK